MVDRFLMKKKIDFGANLSLPALPVFLKMKNAD
jgi:hypothetical protein